LHMRGRVLTCVMAAFCVLAAGLRPARGDDAPQARKAIERGLAFLEQDAVAWRQERGDPNLRRCGGPNRATFNN
jgi:hypothetical protein